MREILSNTCTISRSEVIRESSAPDGATKFLLRLRDSQTIESVLLPYPDRLSVCVSSQVGCAAGCAFCATAQCGFVRNLSAGEIVDQVITMQERAGHRVSHVVMMGMGEPLMNLPDVTKSLGLLRDEVGISMRRITVSTVGITPAIRKLQELDTQITLAVSLHASNDDLRRRLIPLASKYPLGELIEACRDYANHTKRRVTFEYLLLAGVNDSHADAIRLAALIKGILCHVNLIPYNEIIGGEFSRPPGRVIEAFRSELQRAGVEVTQRAERGHSVSAACGQLKRL